MKTNIRYIAHPNQELKDHLLSVSEFCYENASKIGLGDCGKLLGLLHDIGKYNNQFQVYIKSATGILNPDIDDDYVDTDGLRGRIDHSTAGGQLVWHRLSTAGSETRLIAKALALCLVSHHSGLIDCLSYEAKPVFLKRMEKPTKWTHLNEVFANCDNSIIDKIDRLLSTHGLFDQLLNVMKDVKAVKGRAGQKIRIFKIGQIIRFLFSCLIDADRTDACITEKPFLKTELLSYNKTDWNLLISRLETKLEIFKNNSNPKPIDTIRAKISENCIIAAERQRGIFTLTVPTGGGKTLASLRFALAHAKKHNLDRIFYVVPFTTIIDQNADDIRSILEPKTEAYSSIVLEHHSNITPDKETWRSKILSENWNAPVIFTTSVQLLETLYSGGTQSVRRLHKLANSLIIFDEIQTLPIKCVHMFNNSINFLVESCGSSVIMCTATQPLLNKVDTEKGACAFDEKSEIIHDVKTLFDDLKRVQIKDQRKANLSRI